jgi:hypothetical protein
MLANAASAARLVQIGIGEPGLMALPTRPAILLRKRGSCDDALPGVAPGLAWLGVMLPYTPVQFLLFHEAAKRPAGVGWLERAQDLALVMTSANPGGEPLVVGNSEALLRLYGIADAFLMHDRDIVTRCDDSVARITTGGLQFIRRARGYTPRAIKLPVSGPSVLAVGAWFKNTICVTRGDEAYVSQHVGDLDNAAVCDFLEESVAQLLKLLACRTGDRGARPAPGFPFDTFCRRLCPAASPAAAGHPAPSCARRGSARRTRPAGQHTWRCRSTALASGPMARPGVANCCALTAPASSVSVIYRAAGAAGWRPRRQRAVANGGGVLHQTWSQPAKSRERFSGQQAAPAVAQMLAATSIARRRPAWAGCSMPLPACSASRR